MRMCSRLSRMAVNFKGTIWYNMVVKTLKCKEEPNYTHYPPLWLKIPVFA